jgi:hypothetical protein
MNRHKDKILLALIIALSITLVYLLASCLSNAITVNPYSEYASKKFACQLDSNQPFTVWVHVTMKDSMAKPEAVLVATNVFIHEIPNASFTLKSATVDDFGIWTVKLS